MNKADRDIARWAWLDVARDGKSGVGAEVENLRAFSLLFAGYVERELEHEAENAEDLEYFAFLLASLIDALETALERVSMRNIREIRREVEQAQVKVKAA